MFFIFLIRKVCWVLANGEALVYCRVKSAVIAPLAGSGIAVLYTKLTDMLRLLLM